MIGAFVVKVRVAEDEERDEVETLLYIGDMSTLVPHLMSKLADRNMTPATIQSIRRLKVDDVYLDEAIP